MDSHITMNFGISVVFPWTYGYLMFTEFCVISFNLHMWFFSSLNMHKAYYKYII